ncbi:MAG: MFS transporter [Hyphomonadaceae bacterium]|nr:MFS transporter [Hyphomonadaceae bacterium]
MAAASPTSAKRTGQGASGSLAALILVVLVGMIGFGVFLPIFPFLALHLGATATEATIAMGAYSFGQLIASPFWGRLSDRIGRKPVLVVGLVGASASYCLLAHANSVEMLGLARLFGGLMAGNIGAAFAAATDLADDRTRARNMGLLGASFALGFIVGPAIGAALVGPEATAEGFRRVCFAAAAFAMLAAVGAFLFFRETLPAEARRSREAPRISRMKLLRERPALLQLILVTLLMITAQALMESTFGLWAGAALEWGPREVGWAFTGLGVMTVLLQGGGAGALARTLGEWRVMLVGLGLFAVGFVMLALARTPLHAAVTLGVLAIGAGMATPSLNSLIGAQSTEADRGVVMGINQSASALGRVLGPAVAGIIFDGLGHWAPFAIGAVILVGALALASATRAEKPSVAG